MYRFGCQIGLSHAAAFLAGDRSDPLYRLLTGSTIHIGRAGSSSGRPAAGDCVPTRASPVCSTPEATADPVAYTSAPFEADTGFRGRGDLLRRRVRATRAGRHRAVPARGGGIRRDPRDRPLGHPAGRPGHRRRPSRPDQPVGRVAGEDSAQSFIEGVTRLGSHVAFDDFGTGYGGFTYVKRLPVDYLEIDVEFVRDLAQNPASQHVVRAVVNRARDFGHRTIAEGVDDQKTLELLRALGVDFAQGFGIGRPAPLDQVLRSA
jgi:hypothetical protein